MDCAFQSYCIEPIIDNSVSSGGCTLESNMESSRLFKVDSNFIGHSHAAVESINFWNFTALLTNTLQALP